MSAENRGKLLRGLVTAAIIAEGVNVGYSLVTHHDISHSLSKEVMMALAGDPSSDFSSHRLTISPTPTTSMLAIPNATTAYTETPFVLPSVTIAPPTPTKEATPTPEQEQLKFCELSSVKTLQDIKNQCTIPFDKLKLVDHSLAAYSQPFDRSKFKKGAYVTDAVTFLMYGTGKGYFKNDAERPYHLGLVAYSETTYTDSQGNKQVMDFLILPIEVPDQNDPQVSKWVKGMFIFPSTWEKQGQLGYLLGLWMKNGPIIYQNEYWSGIISPTNLKNPVTEKTFNAYPDMAQRFANTVANDNLSSLTEPNMFLEVTVTR